MIYFMLGEMLMIEIIFGKGRRGRRIGRRKKGKRMTNLWSYLMMMAPANVF